ncbi:MAG: hypothetical protein Q9226_001640 [Calogaya cf. arnoldii]
MSDHADLEASHSVAARFSGCLTSYRQLYFSLASRQAKGAEDINLTEVSDNYGRMNIWGAESGALRIGRGSLDDILRTNQNLQSILLELLGDLSEAIGIALLKFQSDEGLSSENDLAAEKYNLDSLSSTTAVSEPSGDGEEPYPEPTNARFLISVIFEYIGSLYKLLKNLRRTTVHEKYIRSASKESDASHFAIADQRHIEDKFPIASKVLVRRLGLANTRRRQQLKYWEEHHAIPGQDLSSALYSKQSGLGSGENGVSKSTTKASHDGQIPSSSVSTPSKASHQSLTTVAQSLLQDDASLSGQRNTVYAPSQPERSSNLRVPNVPNVPADQASFECPYCHAQLNTSDMKQRVLWK